MILSHLSLMPIPQLSHAWPLPEMRDTWTAHIRSLAKKHGGRAIVKYMGNGIYFKFLWVLSQIFHLPEFVRYQKHFGSKINYVSCPSLTSARFPGQCDSNIHLSSAIYINRPYFHTNEQLSSTICGRSHFSCNLPASLRTQHIIKHLLCKFGNHTSFQSGSQQCWILWKFNTYK